MFGPTVKAKVLNELKEDSGASVINGYRATGSSALVSWQVPLDPF